MLYDWDLAIFRFVHLETHRDWLDPFGTVLSYSGLGVSEALFCVVLLVSTRTRPFAVPLGLATAIAGFLFADGIKGLIARDRPSLLSFSLPQEAFQFHSFPSGHTASSFGLAVMAYLLTREGDFRWMGLLALLWASLVGWSRIYRGVHWPSDVLGGALCGFIGAVVAYLILEKYNLIPAASIFPSEGDDTVHSDVELFNQ